jgi:hypothetical protein
VAQRLGHPSRSSVSADDAVAAVSCEAAQGAQGQSRAYPRSDRTDGRLGLVDQRRALDHGGAAVADRQGRARRAHLVNKTPMPHPMHLHGHKFQMVEVDGRRFPGAVRDTVLEPPARRVVAADANNPGLWSIAICSTTPMPRCSRPCGTAVRVIRESVDDQ